MNEPQIPFDFAVLKAKPALAKLYETNTGMNALRSGVEEVISQLQSYSLYQETEQDFEKIKQEIGLEKFDENTRKVLPHYAKSNDISQILRMIVLYATKNLTDTHANERFYVANSDEKALISIYKPNALN